MRVYIAGPMTWVGPPTWNFEAFAKAKRDIAALGLTPVSPTDNGLDPNTSSWHDNMRADIPMLCTCQAIVLLENWDKGRGAPIEKQIAEWLGMRVFVGLKELEEAVAYESDCGCR